MSRVAIASSVAVLVLAGPGFAWLDPGAPDVDVLLNDDDTQMLFYAGPNNQQEWLLNKGQSTIIRIRGHQDPSILKWDASKLEPYRGKEILEAELHLCRYDGASTINVVNALCAATINADWWEGSQSGGTAAPGDPCWRWRSMPVDPNNPLPTDEWTYTGSDFTTASFGNFGTLTCTGYKASDTFKQYTNGGYYWIALKLDPAIIHAMILDNYGIVVTDPRGYDTGNPTIYSANQNTTVQPRLYIKAGAADTTPTGDATNLSVSPGEWNGEVILSFDAPSDSQDARAFGYDVRYATHSDFATATKVARWRIPRPDEPGARQQVFIEYLTAGQTYTFFVQAYDKAGNTGNVAQTSFSLPTAVPTPALADGGLATPDPSGKTIRTVGGVLNYWVCSELAKVNPLTGNRIADGYTGSGADDYKKANVVWDAGTNTVTLRCARNEVAAFQLIVERLVGSLTNVSVSAGDLSGPGGAMISASDSIEFFKLHYVNEGGTPYPDGAIPLQSPFAGTFDIPDGNTNPGGANQSAWCDLYVPRDATAGTYTATLTLDCDQISPVSIDLNVVVQDVMLPDWPTFVVDLNGYGNKWSSEASRYQVFQLCHKHRMVPNTLPYGWSGSTTSDRRPELTGSGPTRTVSSWTTFANNYGPFFDGSGFSPDHPTYPYHGPGENTPIAYFYTTFHECWPVHIGDATWGFDADGMGHAYWNSLYDAGGSSRHEFYLESPDVLSAFPAGYATGYSNIAQEFAQYAQDHNWQTAFQMYLNNKGTYSNTNSLWTLEEQYIFDDFRADKWFLGLCRDGVEAAGAPNAKWHWRIDTSTRWGQNWGELRDICNLRVVGSDINWYYRQIRYRRHLEPQPDEFWYYFGGPMPSVSLTAHSADFLQKWSHGLVGGIPYWDNYRTNWDNAEQLAIVPSGDSVPGHGYFDGRLATIRMKGMRFGQQLIEYLNLLADEPDWNGTLARRALSDRYGDHSGYPYDPWGGDAYDDVGILDYYRLRADLMASLAGGPSLPLVAFDLTASSGDESVTPASLSVSLSASYSQTVTVDCAVTGGDATGGGVDYTLAAGTLTFDPNDISKTIDITIVDDGLVESDETIEVTLSSPSSASLGANTVHTYTILDNDLPPNQAPSVDAGSDQTITLPTDTVNVDGTVTDDGSPDPPGAFTTLWTKDSGPGVVTFGDDTAIDTTATFSLAGVYVLRLEADDSELTDSDTVTITVNAEPQPAVAFDLTASSGDESVTPASLSVSLSAAYVQTVTVDYAVTGGDATGGGVDYTLAAGTLTFDPYDTAETIDITIVDDSEEESDETIEVTLSNPVNATLGANTVHTYTIVDNEGPIQDFANADIAVTGDVSGSYLDTQASDDVYESITEVRVGNPVKGFSALEHMWTIDVTGGLAVTFCVEAYRTTSSDGDDFVLAYSEDDETYIDMVTITKTVDDDTAQSYVLPSSLVGTVYIRATDTDHTRGNQAMDTIYIDQMYIESAGEPGEPTVQFDLVSSSGNESATPASLAVSLSAASAQTVTVDYTVTGGTATGRVDYTLAAGTLTFDPNDVSKTIDISVVDDGEDETDETIEVTLSNPTGATLGANTVHTYTILDNDGIAPPGQASSPSPTDGATKVSRSVILSWTAGSGADSHDVYFGTNPNPGASEFQGNQTGTTFDPGYLGKNTWHYWRIDEVNAGGTTTGLVWSFRTGR